MAAATEVRDETIEVGDLKIHVGQWTVTASTNTITFSDMSNIRYARAYVNGTEETDLALSLSSNVLTTAGHSSGSETWDILVIGN